MADVVVSEKQCCSCKNILPASCFSAGKAKKDGLAANCKACQAEYTKKWRAENAEKIKADKKADYDVNREEHLRKAKEWALANPEKKKETDKRWRMENADRKRENDRLWREMAGESRLEQKRQYHAANREKISEKRRLERLADPEGSKAKDRARYKKRKHLISQQRKEAYATNKNGFRDRMKAYRMAKGEQIREWRLRYYESRKAIDDSFLLRCRMAVGIRKSLKTGKAGVSWLNLVPYTLHELKKHLIRTMPKGYTWDDFLSGELHIDHRLPVSKFNIKSASDIDFQRCWAKRNLQLLPSKENISKGAKLEKPFQPSFVGI